IRGAKRRGKPWRTTRADPAAARRSDLVARDFTAQRPNALWVADFTYLRCWGGLLFFAFIIDVFSRMVVGWQLAANMRTTLVLDALRMALGLREPGADVALVHHSDLGSQYTSIDYTQTSHDHRVLATVEYVGWFNHDRLHESLGDIPPVEFEQLHAARGPISGNRIGRGLLAEGRKRAHKAPNPPRRSRRGPKRRRPGPFEIHAGGRRGA